MAVNFLAKELLNFSVKHRRRQLREQRSDCIKSCVHGVTQSMNVNKRYRRPTTFEYLRLYDNEYIQWLSHKHCGARADESDS